MRDKITKRSVDALKPEADGTDHEEDGRERQIPGTRDRHGSSLTVSP